MDKVEIGREPTVALFHLEGDNICFRGLDAGLIWEGYERPLFDIWTAKTVAGYISTPERRITRDFGTGAFLITVKSEMKQYLLITYEYNGKQYVDFGGTGPWVK